MKKILSLDQASITTGYAYFEDEQLKEVNHFTCKESDFGDRLVEFKSHIIDLLNKYNPDEVIFEDIQLQNTVRGKEVSNGGVIVFKKLAEVFGVLYELLSEKNIPNQAIPPNVWKATFKIAGKGRDKEKALSQKWVFSHFGVKCTDDEADSVCIGYHIINKRNREFDWS